MNIRQSGYTVGAFLAAGLVIPLSIQLARAQDGSRTMAPPPPPAEWGGGMGMAPPSPPSMIQDSSTVYVLMGGQLVRVDKESMKVTGRAQILEPMRGGMNMGGRGGPGGRGGGGGFGGGAGGAGGLGGQPGQPGQGGGGAGGLGGSGGK